MSAALGRFLMHGPPEVVSLAIDLHEHLVQIPALAAGFHASDAALFFSAAKNGLRVPGSSDHRFR